MELQHGTPGFAARVLTTPPPPPQFNVGKSDRQNIDFGFDFGAAGSAVFGHAAGSGAARFKNCKQKFAS